MSEDDERVTRIRHVSNLSHRTAAQLNGMTMRTGVNMVTLCFLLGIDRERIDDEKRADRGTFSSSSAGTDERNDGLVEGTD